MFFVLSISHHTTYKYFVFFLKLLIFITVYYLHFFSVFTILLIDLELFNNECENE